MNSERLSAHMEGRLAALREAKAKGVKIVGYFPGNFVPEEMIYASGAIPLCLIDGGNPRPTREALSMVPGIICPFARAQIGERMLGDNPYYKMLDMVVAPVTCQHLKKVSEVWEYSGEMEIFKLGVPHETHGAFELEYFTDRLRVLQKKLEALTGRVITDESLRSAVSLYDRMRGHFAGLSLMRCNPHSPVSALDFVKLNHASFYADPELMVEELSGMLEVSKNAYEAVTDAPRLLVMGPNLARGDYDLFDLVDAAGGKVVIEDFFEGVRDYRQFVGNDGDTVMALARSYLRHGMPPAFMRSSTRERLDFTLKLIDEFHVAGMIWYELICCETYDQEAYFFHREMKKRGIPMLTVESSYDALDTGPLRTRLEAFVELIKGGPAHG